MLDEANPRSLGFQMACLSDDVEKLPKLPGREARTPEQRVMLSTLTALRLAEVKLLAARWQIGSVHLNGPNLALGYRNAKKAHQLADRSEGRLKVVDEKDIYGRWQEGEDTPEAMYELLKVLLRGG